MSFLPRGLLISNGLPGHVSASDPTAALNPSGFDVASLDFSDIFIESLDEDDEESLDNSDVD